MKKHLSFIYPSSLPHFPLYSCYVHQLPLLVLLILFTLHPILRLFIYFTSHWVFFFNYSSSTLLFILFFFTSHSFLLVMFINSHSFCYSSCLFTIHPVLLPFLLLLIYFTSHWFFFVASSTPTLFVYTILLHFPHFSSYYVHQLPLFLLYCFLTYHSFVHLYLRYFPLCCFLYSHIDEPIKVFCLCFVEMLLWLFASKGYCHCCLLDFENEFESFYCLSVWPCMLSIVLQRIRLQANSMHAWMCTWMCCYNELVGFELCRQSCAVI